MNRYYDLFTLCFELWTYLPKIKIFMISIVNYFLRIIFLRV